MPSFDDFSLQPATRAALANMDITEPTPIQAQAIPALLAGNDLIGQSATGSGKTLAYGIPLVERLSKERVVQALVLVPTRELAVQVSEVLSKLGAGKRLATALLVGGRPYSSQMSALRYGSQIIVGTPGRVQDHLERGTLVLSQLRLCVLDEADQMLDIGFASAIEEILTTTPDTRQMALFSATMPDWIEKLQKKFLKNPVHVSITLGEGEQSTIEQIAYQVPQDQKLAALCTLLHSAAGESSLIFGRTKFGVEKLGKHLTKLGFAVGTLHGDKSQRAREDVLTAFRRGQVQTLLATNVAARGLDIKDIYQVINYELPESSDLFTHRIGRTGRMGKQGKAITLLAPSDLSKWRHMARSLGTPVTLQRLAIDPDALNTSIAPVPLEVLPVEREQSNARPIHERRRFPSEPSDERQPRRERRRFPSEPGDEQQPVREHERFAPEQSDERQPRRERRHFPSESNNEQRPARERFAPDQEQGKFVRTNVENKKPFVENSNRETPARQSEGFSQSERPYSERARDSRRGASSSFGRTPGTRKTPVFVATEPKQRTGKRRLGATSAGQARRTTATKRFAGR